MSNQIVVKTLNEFLGHTLVEVNLYAAGDRFSSMDDLTEDLVASYPTPVNELTSLVKTPDDDQVTVVTFMREDGHCIVLQHQRDCCEEVWLEDVDGEWSDLIGSSFIVAEEVTHKQEDGANGYESSTWTFYKFSTSKGSVTLRFIGTSNGYYSEDVDVLVFPPQQT